MLELLGLGFLLSLFRRKQYRLHDGAFRVDKVRPGFGMNGRIYRQEHPTVKEYKKAWKKGGVLPPLCCPNCGELLGRKFCTGCGGKVTRKSFG